MPRNTRFKKRTIAVLVGAAIMAGSAPLYAVVAAGPTTRLNNITPQDRQAAAARAAAKGFTVAPMGTVTTTATGGTTTGPGTGTTGPGAGTTGPGGAVISAPGALPMATPGDAPHYFSHPNYANSPLRVPLVGVTVIDPAATPGSGAVLAAQVDAAGAITAITVVSGGTGYSAGSTIEIKPLANGTGGGASATPTIDAATGAITAVTVDQAGSGFLSPGIAKFVDTLAGLTPAGANSFGDYIPLAVADHSNPAFVHPAPTAADPAATAPDDYYEIALVQYAKRFHRDLPPALLRGYVQLASAGVPGAVPLYNDMPDGTRVALTLPNGLPAMAVDNPHYLGPIIAASKDTPVRIKFYNLLPKGEGGNLFLPVDTTVMGAGMGPTGAGMPEANPQMPACGNVPKPADCFAENRATLHLHGGINPWISDGTPHQWITPANDTDQTAGGPLKVPQGASVSPVPDMGDANDQRDGVMTFFWPNQQSARLMFYHDHAHGITRLNVYGGEAAGYLISDTAEANLIAGGVIPGAADTIPLVIQDKTFVPDTWQLAAQDNTWDTARWGGVGSLWLPHVYSPAQSPGDASGVNQFGRWAYGPWFWPPTTNIDHGPIGNPYYCGPDSLDANGNACATPCNPDLQWCEPNIMPGTPYNSMGMEAFHDTPLVNGVVYPTVELDPKTYRLRILNAANDRFVNLSLYKAVDAAGTVCDTANPTPVAEVTGVACTEVALNPAEVAGALTDPAGVFPTPVAGTEGPSWVQIGTEGGFLPAPVVIPPQPITWVTDPTVFNAGNVDKHSLLVGPAERADVIVDLSAYAGQTLILYNDAPAAFPARDPRYDYYTGNPDLTSTGGATSTPAGFGPNTRTVMRIVVKGTPPAPAFDVVPLQTAFAHKADGSGVFESSQPPIIVGQGAYNSAYGTAFSSNGATAGLVQIFDTSFSFKTLAGGATGASVTLPLAPKQIQDEMGEAFEHGYGRMSGNLGVETPNAQAGAQNMILYAYPHPPTEVIQGLPVGVTAAAIGSAGDNTQIWKITHNGVDTHPIHFHLYDVQLINRVGWDGIIRKADANELGWKDTVRISPLEDTIVALRPRVPDVPWELPDSVRLLDPSMPDGAMLSLGPTFAPNGQPVTITNHPVNFGWEYVWHCHILSHEEMDMMRPQVIGVAPKAPGALAVTTAGTVTWTDNSITEQGFVVQRANDAAFTTGVVEFSTGPSVGTGGIMTYADSSAVNGSTYYYRVKATKVVGDTENYGGNFFPSMTVASDFTDGVPQTISKATIADLTSLTYTVLSNPVRVRLNWGYTNGTQTGFVIQRSTDGLTFSQVGTVGRNARAFTDTTGVVPGTTYTYKVQAVGNGGATSNWSSVTVPLPAVPVAPTIQSATAVRNGGNDRVTVTWGDVAGETGYTLQRATNATFTAGLTTSNLAANTTMWSGNVARLRTFYFRIRANNNVVGNSAWSPTVFVSTP